MEGLVFFTILFSIFAGIYANKKNRSGIGYFILSLFISPIITFIIIAIAGEKDI